MIPASAKRVGHTGKRVEHVSNTGTVISAKHGPRPHTGPRAAPGCIISGVGYNRWTAGQPHGPSYSAPRTRSRQQSVLDTPESVANPGASVSNTGIGRAAPRARPTPRPHTCVQHRRTCIQCIQHGEKCVEDRGKRVRHTNMCVHQRGTRAGHGEGVYAPGP